MLAKYTSDKHFEPGSRTRVAIGGARRRLRIGPKQQMGSAAEHTPTTTTTTTGPPPITTVTIESTGPRVRGIGTGGSGSMSDEYLPPSPPAVEITIQSECLATEPQGTTSTVGHI